KVGSCLPLMPKTPAGGHRAKWQRKADCQLKAYSPPPEFQAEPVEVLPENERLPEWRAGRQLPPRARQPTTRSSLAAPEARRPLPAGEAIRLLRFRAARRGCRRGAVERLSSVCGAATDELPAGLPLASASSRAPTSRRVPESRKCLLRQRQAVPST